MKTKASRPLGTGTVNFAVNMPAAERRLIGRYAFRRNQSTGQVIRGWILEGLEKDAPAEGAKLRRLRRMRAVHQGRPTFCLKA